MKGFRVEQPGSDYYKTFDLEFVRRWIGSGGHSQQLPIWAYHFMSQARKGDGR
jgi:hypothetical protein